MTQHTDTATRARELRDSQGLTQDELAARANVSRSMIQHMESGRPPKRASNLRKIAEALGVAVDDLAGEPDPDRPMTIREAAEVVADEALERGVSVQQVIDEMLGRKNP